MVPRRRIRLRARDLGAVLVVVSPGADATPSTGHSVLGGDVTRQEEAPQPTQGRSGAGAFAETRAPVEPERPPGEPPSVARVVSADRDHRILWGNKEA